MASQQSARGALVSWVAILAIGFITSLVFAFYYWAAARKSDDEFASYKKKYNEIVSDGALAGADVQALKEARNAENSGFSQQEKLLNVAIGQRDNLIKAVTGANMPAQQAMTTVKTMLDEVGKKTKLTGDSLGGAVSSMASATADLQAQVDGLKQQLLAAKKNEEDTIKRTGDQLVAKDKQIEMIRTDAVATVDAANKDRAGNKGVVDQIQAAVDAERKAAADNMAKLQGSLADKDRQIAKQSKDLDKASSRLSLYRPDAKSMSIRQGDAHVIRNPATGVIYIDIGQGDQVTPGLTFEVYDKGLGIPPLREDAPDSEIPQGKAAIEVVRVGIATSECRVLSETKGASPITEGDIVSNLVYDRNTKQNFVVFGRFDLDANEVATSEDTEVIRRLITQWGGHLMPAINTDTDYVVLGKEPTVPVFSREELQDPINAKKYADATAELDAYQAVRNMAKDLNVPILNQNRFLYYIGYFDLAKR